MTLSVWAYRRDPNTHDIVYLDVEPDPPCNDLAGFEIWRGQVWGSSVAKNLGLTILPSLTRMDVFAEASELDTLEQELGLLEKNLSVLAAHAKTLEETILFRIKNILEAIRLARQVPDGAGGVNIG